MAGSDCRTFPRHRWGHHLGPDHSKSSLPVESATLTGNEDEFGGFCKNCDSSGHFLQHEEWHQDIEWIWTILDAQLSCCETIHNHHLKPSICQQISLGMTLWLANWWGERRARDSGPLSSDRASARPPTTVTTTATHFRLPYRHPRRNSSSSYGHVSQTLP